jgi:hypothetical protein
MSVTFPKLTIVDAAWTAPFGPSPTPGYPAVNTRMLLGSTDPVAPSWYAAKFILTPIALYPFQTNPDLPGSQYNISLGHWSRYLADSAGLPCTRDSTRISVYDRTVLHQDVFVRASVRVFLEGPFDTSTNLMHRHLNTGGQLAVHFPGATIPANAVDSIDVELRTDSSQTGSTTRKHRPAWLLTDGSITDFSDTTRTYVEFDTTAGNYYLVIRHRNHLGIMTASPQALTSSAPPPYDFTTFQTRAYGSNPMKSVGLFFAMYASDADGNTGVGASDLVNVREAVGSTAYDANDVDMNGGVGASDLVLTRANIGQASQVPK